MIGRTEVDLVDDFAYPLPVTAIADWTVAPQARDR
jgi:hypothetical protein